MITAVQKLKPHLTRDKRRECVKWKTKQKQGPGPPGCSLQLRGNRNRIAVTRVLSMTSDTGEAGHSPLLAGRVASPGCPGWELHVSLGR